MLCLGTQCPNELHSDLHSQGLGSDPFGPARNHQVMFTSEASVSDDGEYEGAGAVDAQAVHIDFMPGRGLRRY